MLHNIDKFLVIVKHRDVFYTTDNTEVGADVVEDEEYNGVEHAYVIFRSCDEIWYRQDNVDS